MKMHFGIKICVYSLVLYMIEFNIFAQKYDYKNCRMDFILPINIGNTNNANNILYKLNRYTLYLYQIKLLSIMQMDCDIGYCQFLIFNIK